MPEEYRAYVLCKLFHWTEDEYLDTTNRFCEDAIGFLNIEASASPKEPLEPGHVHIESG